MLVVDFNCPALPPIGMTLYARKTDYDAGRCTAGPLHLRTRLAHHTSQCVRGPCKPLWCFLFCLPYWTHRAWPTNLMPGATTGCNPQSENRDGFRFVLHACKPMGFPCTLALQDGDCCPPGLPLCPYLPPPTPFPSWLRTAVSFRHSLANTPAPRCVHVSPPLTYS